MYTSGVPQQQNIATFVASGKGAREEGMKAIGEVADGAKKFVDDGEIFIDVNDSDCVVINQTKRDDQGRVIKQQEQYQKSIMGMFMRWLAGKQVTGTQNIRVSDGQTGTADPGLAIPVSGGRGQAPEERSPAAPTEERGTP